MSKILNIVVPMAGRGTSFKEAGYSFPKPLIDIEGKAMIELVVKNLTPKCKHKFIFLGLREHFENFDLEHILKNITNNDFETIKLTDVTEGAACTVLMAKKYIDNENDLLIVNADQFIEFDVNEFIRTARQGEKDGLIMTFKASHPKWSYVRLGKNNRVLETAEKKVISEHATAGLYYFSKGANFIKSCESMILKDIKVKNEFYICPTYNEMILKDKNIFSYHMDQSKIHGLGTPEDLHSFEKKLNLNLIKIN